MRKVDDGEKKKEKKEKKKKIMTFIVATSVVASRPPDRRLTGTPHARANDWFPGMHPDFNVWIKVGICNCVRDTAVILWVPTFFEIIGIRIQMILDNSKTIWRKGTFGSWRTKYLYFEETKVLGSFWEEDQYCLFPEPIYKLLQWPTGGTKLQI